MGWGGGGGGGVEGLSKVEQVDDGREEGPLLAVHVEHPVARAQHGVDREEPLLRVERRQLNLRARLGAGLGLGLGLGLELAWGEG